MQKKTLKACIKALTKQHNAIKADYTPSSHAHLSSIRDRALSALFTATREFEILIKRYERLGGE